MIFFIICLIAGFAIGRAIQNWRIQRLTDQMVQLEHQKRMIQTGNPFWAIFPEANRKEDENKS